jgi:hypothetical protein
VEGRQGLLLGPSRQQDLDVVPVVDRQLVGQVGPHEHAVRRGGEGPHGVGGGAVEEERVGERGDPGEAGGIDRGEVGPVLVVGPDEDAVLELEDDRGHVDDAGHFVAGGQLQRVGLAAQDARGDAQVRADDVPGVRPLGCVIGRGEDGEVDAERDHQPEAGHGGAERPRTAAQAAGEEAAHGRAEPGRRGHGQPAAGQLEHPHRQQRAAHPRHERGEQEGGGATPPARA